MTARVEVDTAWAVVSDELPDGRTVAYYGRRHGAPDRGIEVQLVQMFDELGALTDVPFVRIRADGSVIDAEIGVDRLTALAGAIQLTAIELRAVTGERR